MTIYLSQFLHRILLSQRSPLLKQVEYVGIESDCRHSGGQGQTFIFQLQKESEELKKVETRNKKFQKEIVVLKNN